MIYLQLLWSFLQIGLLSFGGGYAAMPLIQDQVVQRHSWISMTAFADIITIAEMTPGPIAVNSATFVGLKIAGLPGAVIATLGCVLPACLIVLALAKFYYRYRNLTIIQNVLTYLRPAIVALIGSAGLSILALVLFEGDAFSFQPGALKPAGVLLFAAGLFVLRRWKPSPILVIFGAGILGMLFFAVS